MGFNGIIIHLMEYTRPGKRLQFANLNMAQSK